MTIKIDVDGVIRDMLGAMCKMYYKFDPIVKEENITDYDVEKSFPLIKMKTGMSAHDYFFVINAEQSGFYNKIYTLKFLNYYGIPYDDICFTRDKWAIEGDYIIDDNPEFLNDEREKAKKIIIDAPYNRQETKYHRFYNLTQAADFILLGEYEKKEQINFNEQPFKIYTPWDSHECCRNCPNNPKNNPYASGICNCVLPYMQTTGTDYDTIIATEFDKTFTQNKSTITNKVED